MRLPSERRDAPRIDDEAGTKIPGFPACTEHDFADENDEEHPESDKER
jgi:hypothetical protein